MKMHCPHCGVRGLVDDSHLLRKVRCPKCEQIFRVQEEKEVALDQHEPHDQMLEDRTHKQAYAETVEAVSDTTLYADQENGGPIEATTASEIIEEEVAEAGATEIYGVDEAAQDEKPTSSILYSDTVDELDAAAAKLESLDDLAESEEDIQAADPYQESADDSREQEDLVWDEITESRAAVTMDNQAEHIDEHHPSEPAGINENAAKEKPQQEPPFMGAAASVDDTVKLTEPWEDFTIGDALAEAWSRTSGVKGTIWMAVVVSALIFIGLAALSAIVTGVSGGGAEGATFSLGTMVVDLLLHVVSMIFTGGLMYMGVRRATNRSIIWKDVFSGFRVVGNVAITAILQTLLVMVGFFLLVLPGIYLFVGYSLALPLVIDKKLTPWEALETSRKAIHRVWWKVFGLYIAMSLIYIISALPLGIGLIWTLPMYVVLGGVLYSYLFDNR